MNKWPDYAVHVIANEPPPREVPVQLYNRKERYWQIAILPPLMMGVDQNGCQVEVNPISPVYTHWCHLIETKGTVG